MFCDEGSLHTLTVTHEVGHAFGLNHSTWTGDMMGSSYWRYRSLDFTPRERLVMQLMLQRQPGNHDPDTDRTPRAAASRSETIVCR